MITSSCITVHGDNGSGKSTLAKKLAKVLGYSHFSTGDFARELALQNGCTSISDYMQREREKDSQFDIDDVIDGQLKIELQKKNIVIDSRLGYFFGKDSVKIYCILDPKTAAKWIFRGDKRRAENFQSIEQLEIELKARQEKDRKAYLQKYNTDYTDSTQYDFVVFSFFYENEQEKMLEKVIQEIEVLEKKKQFV